MKKTYKILIIATIFFLFIAVSLTKGKNRPIYITKDQPSSAANDGRTVYATNKNNLISNDKLQPPIDQAKDRVTKKPFGIFITPKNSPVQPERFYGYHTGTDFEIFPHELNADVPVKAICDGKILTKRWASGYGGVLVESCVLNSQPVTVIYGHLDVSSIPKKVGESLLVGEQIGILGQDKSRQTDGERKHLHLGIHKGTGVNIKGYVNNKSDLDGWIDPMTVIQF